MDITFNKVNFVYQAGTPFESKALYDIDMNIEDGSYTAIVGHTGSGKSTLLQHLNALVKPTSGTVEIGNRVITNATNNKNLKPVRKKVGIVFQFPEAQLFEETVLRDISFGPKNFGVSQEDAEKVAKEMLPLVGLSDEVLEKSPFELSGGQMRRVAIAGVLAMQPEVLVLDEPTAGLDPKGRRDMMQMFKRLHTEQGMTIVLVTHLMDDVTDFADYVYVLEKGTIVKGGTPKEVFADTEWLAEKQLGVPLAAEFAEKLEAKGIHFDEVPMTVAEMADVLAARLNSKVGDAK